MKTKVITTIMITLFLASMLCITPVSATPETWHVLANLADDNPFNNVEAYVTKTDKVLSVEFMVEIVPDAPHYGMGIAISTSIDTIDFQVWYREYATPYGWYYQEYPWDSTVVALGDSETGITATGDHTGKVFTVEIPIDLLGGYGAEYYFAIQFRTTLLGTYPSGLNLWAQTDASLFACQLTPLMVVVSPVDMDGWAFLVTSSNGIGEFVVGPATPPLGVGSVRLFTGTHGDESAQIRNTNYHGTLLNDLTALSYCTYAEQWNGQQIPYIILHVDTDGDYTWDDLLFFEPAYQSPSTGNPSLPDQGAPTLDTWQEWNALIGGWWSLNHPEIATPGVPMPDALGVQPLSVYTRCDHYPNARIVNTASGLGGLRLVAGFASESDVFEGFVDGVIVGVNGETKIYDFEPHPSVIACMHLEDLEEEIDDLSDEDFKPPAADRKAALNDKINDAIAKIIAGDYENAIKRLKGDIRPKLDIDAKQTWLVEPHPELLDKIDAVFEILEGLL